MNDSGFSRASASEWPAPDPSVSLMGVPFWAVTEIRVVEHVLAALNAGTGGWIVTPNLDILRKITRDLECRNLAMQADFLVADGMPLIWASRLKKSPLPERVAGSNLIHSLSAAASGSGKSVYFLGGDPGTAEAAAERLKAANPGLMRAGCCCPPVGFEQDAGFLKNLERELLQARPDIVFVGLGFPKQEKLISRLRQTLPSAWWIGVGISFSFVCGRIRRAPKVFQMLGLEWIHRMVQEPGRLMRRYLLEGLPFATRLFRSAWRERRENSVKTLPDSE